MASRSAAGRGSGRRAKKAGKRRRALPPQQDYYVEQTDKDMLLLIYSNQEESAGPARRARPAGGAGPARRAHPAGAAGPSISTDSGWGSLMPHEILHSVFRMVVGTEGAVPTLCRLAQVCRLWHQVALSPDLWQRVSVSKCWSVPRRSDPPKLKQRVRGTIGGLIRDRLSQVSDFSLHHWEDHVPLVLQSLCSSCPQLTSLTLSQCNKVMADDLVSVAKCCPHLTTLNLQDSHVGSTAVSRFLEVRGAGLRCLYLTLSSQTNGIINLLASGSCPELRLLQVNSAVGVTGYDMKVPAELLQASCPNLEVLRLLNVIFSLKNKPPLLPDGPGFCHLQELCLATSGYTLVTDSDCKRLLRDSTQLRVLDLRGCKNVTSEGISDLPCPDIERLYLGLYNCPKMIYPIPDAYLLTRRWRHSLQELDLTALHYTESDLSQALGILVEGAANDTLQSLSLTGTTVTAAAVRDLVSGCRALTHLDLTSCRYMPRGLKCVYRGQENIRQFLNTLSAKMQENGE